MSTPPPLPGSTDRPWLGRYELLAELAAGGMATVHAARSHGPAGFERLVAIKQLHPHLARKHTFVAMLLDEARLAARIHHPNVVATLDSGGDPERGFYLAMDYIEGGELAELQRAARRCKKRLSAPVALRIAIDALQGLGAAHALCDELGRPLGLVHRDVSPHNLMVGSDGITRLADFGVAKAMGRLAETRTGTIKGKLAYMAPEQAGGHELDHRADLYALGVVLWEVLTRRRLLAASTPERTFKRALLAEAPPPSSVDPRLSPLDGVLAKALARDPDDRFASADAFIHALERAAPALGGVATARMVAKAVELLLAEPLQARRTAVGRALSRARGTADDPAATRRLRTQRRPPPIPEPVAANRHAPAPDDTPRGGVRGWLGALARRLSRPPRAASGDDSEPRALSTDGGSVSDATPMPVTLQEAPQHTPARRTRAGGIAALLVAALLGGLLGMASTEPAGHADAGPVARAWPRPANAPRPREAPAARPLATTADACRDALRAGEPASDHCRRLRPASP